MGKLDDASDLVNRGIDAVFPARRLARQALIANTAGKLMAARAKNPEAYDEAMQYGEESRSSAKRYRDLAKEKASTSTYDTLGIGMKKGGKISASKRADGIAKRGKTRGKMI